MTGKKWMIAAAALTAAVLVGGCGLGGSYSDAVSKNGKEKVLRVGSDTNFPPFEYKEDGKLSGFDMELIQAVADKMGAKLEVKDITFSDLIPAVKEGRVDAVISGMEATAARSKDLSFCDPYCPAGYSILTEKSDDAIQGWDDLKGKVIATQTGTRHAEISIDFGAERVQAFDEKGNVIKALKDGDVDAAVIDTPVALYYAKHDDALKVAGEPKVSENGLAIGVKKGNTELQKEINAALKAVKDDGTYGKMYAKWFGEMK